MLIDALLEKNVSIIGVDCAGVRNGIGRCVINTYPMNYAEMTGLPCRVVAEV